MAGLEDEMANLNYLRYSSAVFKVAKKEVWRMFDWLHHHHYRHEPPAYVGQRLRESEKGMEGIGAKEKAALERQEDPATMDIPLLYRLLQHTCGLRQNCPGFDWARPSEEEQRQSLEHRLYLIKEARNSLCHRPDQYMHLSDHELGTLLQELQEPLCHSLQQAGPRSGRPAGEVHNAVASVKDRLADIQVAVPSSAITPRLPLQDYHYGDSDYDDCDYDDYDYDDYDDDYDYDEYDYNFNYDDSDYDDSDYDGYDYNFVYDDCNDYDEYDEY